MKEYKIVKAFSIWGAEKTRKAIEEIINREAKKGWRVVSVSFAYSTGAYATLERDKNNDDLV